MHKNANVKIDEAVFYFEKNIGVDLLVYTSVISVLRLSQRLGKVIQSHPGLHRETLS